MMIIKWSKLVRAELRWRPEGMPSLIGRIDLNLCGLDEQLCLFSAMLKKALLFEKIPIFALEKFPRS